MEDSESAVNEPLRELFETVLNYHESASSELMNHWEDLKTNSTRILKVEQFIVRPHGRRTDILIECNSLKDMQLWTSCLLSVLNKIVLTTDNFALKRRRKTLHVRFPSAFSRDIWNGLSALMHRTIIQNAELSMKRQLPLNAVDEREKLQQLIDSILEDRKNEIDKLKRFSEELIRNPGRRLAANTLNTHETEDLDQSYFGVRCRNAEDFLMWATCIRFLLDKFAKLKRDTSYEYTYSPCSSVSMVTDDFEGHFNFLKPLSQITKFDSIELHGSTETIIAKYTDFLGQDSVRTISISTQEPSNNYFHLALDLVRRLKPSRVFFTRHGHALETTAFLPQLADVCEIINVLEQHKDGVKMPPIPIAVLREILSRKCRYLEVAGPKTKISLNEAQDFVKVSRVRFRKFLHHLDKEVAVRFPTGNPQSELVAAQIGEYKFEIYEEDEDEYVMNIEHIGIEPTLAEVFH